MVAMCVKRESEREREWEEIVRTLTTTCGLGIATVVSIILFIGNNPT
jgi:hypothetical protein